MELCAADYAKVSPLWSWIT